MHYSKASLYRHYYQRPQESLGYDKEIPTTRFGSTPNHQPAVGIGTFFTCIRNFLLGRIEVHGGLVSIVRTFLSSIEYTSPKTHPGESSCTWTVCASWDNGWGNMANLPSNPNICVRLKDHTGDWELGFVNTHIQ